MAAGQIVTLNVSQTSAPAPSTFQAKGAIISLAGTTLAPQSTQLISTIADLTAILVAPKALTSLAWSGGTVTATTTAPHGWTNPSSVRVTIAGATPAAYNGTVTATITGASTFTYPLVSNPGSETVPGTVVPRSVANLVANFTQEFAQTGARPLYVLELGVGANSVTVAAMSTWLTNNPKTIYSFLVPGQWDDDTDYLNLLNNFDALDAQQYFFTTTIIANEAVYAGNKAVFAFINSPDTPVAVTDAAAPHAVTLRYSPDSSNRVTPLSYAYLFGVTAYPIPGNQTVFANFDTNNINYVGTGAEGGISNTILFRGHLQDGHPFNYWYSADWAQINLKLDCANEIINGSNNALAPLYYDQNGIDRLQNRCYQTMVRAVQNGLALGTPLLVKLPASEFARNYERGDYAGFLPVNAEPFLVYTAANPSNYALGIYGGLSIVYTPLRGFEQIVINLNITDFIGGQ